MLTFFDFFCILHGVRSREQLIKNKKTWDLSSAGRASALQAEGHRFEPYRSHTLKNMARWLNWLERPVHTREVESSSLSLATKRGREQRCCSFFQYIITIPHSYNYEKSSCLEHAVSLKNRVNMRVSEDIFQCKILEHLFQSGLSIYCLDRNVTYIQKSHCKAIFIDFYTVARKPSKPRACLT